jgi:MFS family permease
MKRTTLPTPRADAVPPTRLIDDLRDLPRPVWILCIGSFINRFGTFVVPFLTLYMTGQGFTSRNAGLTIGMIGVGGLLSSLFGGWFADRFGRRRGMATALFTSAVCMVLMSAATTLPAFMAIGFAVGASHGLYGPAANALLSDLLPPSRHVLGYTVVRFAINLGWACGMAAAGFLAKISYLWLFWGDAITSAIFACITLFTLPHGVRSSAVNSGWSPALRSIRHNRPFLCLAAATTCAAVIFFQWGSVVSLYLRDLGHPEEVFGLLMAGNGVMITLFELRISRWTQRRSFRHVIAVGYLLCGLGLAALFATNFTIGTTVSLAIIIAGFGIFTIGEMISLPVSSAYVASLAPDEMRGRYNGVMSMTWSSANIFGPITGLLLYEWSANGVWAFGLALGIAGWVMTWHGTRK